MRVFCRMYSASLSTPVPTLPPSAALDPDLSDAFHANLSNLFDSILGDGNKRPRTSSLSRPSEVQPEKILRVDVPVDQTIESNITVPPVSDAAGTFPTATPENLAAITTTQSAATLLAAAVLGVSPSASQQLPAAASPVTPLAISQQLGASQPAGFQQSPTAETAAPPPVANPQVAAVAAIPPTIQSGVPPLPSASSRPVADGFVVPAGSAAAANHATGPATIANYALVPASSFATTDHAFRPASGQASAAAAANHALAPASDFAAAAANTGSASASDYAAAADCAASINLCCYTQLPQRTCRPLFSSYQRQPTIDKTYC
ncbi:angiomotin-like [Culex pipiens pallens]|uniref:angiomotin-like n=1 Tax=Culex pipiens pallens TaxID=42434 RepID=UPI001953863D|nr:angiomotin-like [Culex pipiens pallens]